MNISIEKLAPNQEYDYLKANRYLSDFATAQALSAALDVGLVDLLQATAEVDIGEILNATTLDGLGLDYLLGFLQAGAILVRHEDKVALTDTFRQVLPFRAFIQAQIDFANVVCPDVLDRFPLLLESENKFMSQAKLFEVFDYNRAIERTDENLAITRRWVRFTTALTHHEARVCCSHHDFSPYEKVMDIGGNSGEFMLEVCKRFLNVEATVVDLPVVCDIGEEHVGRHSEGSRISFCRADALRHPLPQGFDLITFKSILHDWPDDAVRQYIHHVTRSLNNGGRLLIFERSVIDIAQSALPYYLLPMFLFFRSFRTPDLYIECLESEGYTNIKVQYLELETRFYIVSAEFCQQ